MKIIGFGQQMMLEGSGRIQHEISVELADGSVHVLPTSEETVQKLISLFQAAPAKPVPPRPIQRQAPPVQEEYEPPQMQDFGDDSESFEEDPGEMAPVLRRVRPAFLDDEDGNQV